MLPLVRELEKRPETESIVCVTAQHRQLLDCVLRCFELEPDYDLDIMTEGQSLYTVTAKVLTGMEGCLAQAKPDLVLVHGDTATALAAALAAFYAKIPVGHVEAGLRTFDLQSPFPEEADRCLISRLAALNFAPTEANAENLRFERVPGEIFVTGNTVIDAMKMPSKRTAFHSPELAQLDFSRRIVTLTCHRRENYGEPMESIFSAVRELAERHGDITVIYPVHSAPEVRQAAKEILGSTHNVKLIEPLDALDGHEDGLYFYRKIIKECKSFLKEDGKILFEIGNDQGQAVSDMLTYAGFRNVRVIKDLAHNDRVVVGML